MSADPFEVLGLAPAGELTDDDVRAAWRRIAAATHPDRADGGDPDRFATAAAAYTELRTAFGRGEARAATRTARAGQAAGAGARRWHRLIDAVGAGLPVRLLLRAIVAIGAGAGAVFAARPGPACPALAAGALTWLAITARRDVHTARTARRH